MKKQKLNIIFNDRGVQRISVPPGTAEEQLMAVRLTEALLRQVRDLDRVIREAAACDCD